MKTIPTQQKVKLAEEVIKFLYDKGLGDDIDNNTINREKLNAIPKDEIYSCLHNSLILSGVAQSTTI